MVSSLTAIRLQVNDLNDQTAAQSRDGKWRNEHQHGCFVGWLDGWMPECEDEQMKGYLSAKGVKGKLVLHYKH